MVAFSYGKSFVVDEKPATHSGKKEAKQGVGETRRVKIDDKSARRKNKNKGCTAGSKNSAEAPDCKSTAASKPQEYVIDSSFTRFGVSVYIDTLVTDCDFLRMKFFLL